MLFSDSAMSDSLQPHGLQHSRLPCPSPYPGTCSNSSPSSRWCCLTISSSVVPFSSCLQFSQHQGLFQRVSSSHQMAKVLKLQHQSFQWIFRTDSFSIDWFDPLAVQGTLKNTSKHGLQADYVTFAGQQNVSTRTECSISNCFFCFQPSLWSNSHIHTWLLEKP